MPAGRARLAQAGSWLAAGYADTYGTNVTIWDAAGVGSTSNPSENGEVEIGAQWAQVWDLEAFRLTTGGKLSITGGYDFVNPAQGQTRGALFLNAGGTPAYGSTNPIYPPTDLGNATYPNSPTWNYNYAITFDSFAPDGKSGTYTVWRPSPTATILDQMHGPLGDYCGDYSNPYYIAAGWVPYITGGIFSYKSGVSNVDAGITGALGDLHNIIYDIDLGFLKSDNNGVSPATYLHFTYLCGNDNLMGHLDANAVPIPPSVLLLGSGLLGLAGLRRFRKI